MLAGTLDDFTLADVLRLIGGARRTGSLAVARDEGAGDLYFRDGVVSGAVPRYERRTEPSSPNRAVEDLTFDLMRWGRGEFSWSPAADAPAGPEAAVDVDELLRDVARRMGELAEIQALVPSEEAILTMAPQPPEGAVQINITPAEWRVLVLVDGHRSVAEVATTAGLDDLDAMKLLYGLASAGLVTAPAVASGEVSDMSDMTVVSDVSDNPREETYAEPAPEPEPEPDAFLAEFEIEPVAPFASMPAAPAEAPAVDRSTAARELAGLFDDFEPPAGMQRMEAPPTPPHLPRRVEDDEQVTRGLISRLIDGVKGL